MNAILPKTEVDFYANKKLNEHGKQLLSILNLTTLNKQQVDMICSLRIKDTTIYDDTTKFKLE